MKVYVVIASEIIEGIDIDEVDSIWFTEEDAHERGEQLMLDETTNWDYFEVRAMEVHGKQHLKVISKVIKVIEDDERK